MKNTEIAEMFYEIADYLEIQDVEFKPRAYRTAARNIESLSEPIEDIHNRGDLKEIEGVGASLAEKIAEYLETGELEYYRELKADLPIDIEAITSVEGVGPKTAKKLYQGLEVTDLDSLETAAEAGEIASLEGFGERSQQNILEHIDRAKQSQERMLLGRAFPIATTVKQRLEHAEAFDDVSLVGSFRRRRATVGDIDILATASEPATAMEVFCSHDDVKEVLAQGETKSSVIASGDLQMDLRIVSDEEYGAALIYFTGSKDHNIMLRNRAIERDWKLNEYGLFDISDVDEESEGQRAGDRVAGAAERGVYGALGCEWIAPELREDTGEVTAAAAGDLPDLVELDDIRGDLQMHSEYSDGTHTVRELAEAADERGLEYILITDHGPNAPIPEKLDAEELEAQRADIGAINDDSQIEVEVLQGIEMEITTDGPPETDEIAQNCDLVVGALHSRPENPTELLIDACREYPIDILAHPTNRLLNERAPLELDLDALMEAAATEKVAIEINAQPSRLDLGWHAVKQYRDTVQFVVSTDAHTTGELDHMHLGVAQARRGWCAPTNVLNTRPLPALRSFFST